MNCSQRLTYALLESELLADCCADLTNHILLKSGLKNLKRVTQRICHSDIRFIIPQDGNVYTFTIVLPYDPLVNKKSRYSPNME